MAFYHFVALFGARIRYAVANLGLACRMLGQLLGAVGVVVQRPRLLINQVHFLGNHSLVIVAISALFIGAVLGLQAFYTLNRVGSEAMVGVLVAPSLVRELSPVVVALLFAGRAGTSVTAEIGLMKAGEQLDAMTMMGVDPLRRVFAPRFFAGGLVMPLLTALFSMICIYGGYLVAVRWLGVDGGLYWGMMNDAVSVRNDIVNGMIKGLVFGFTVSFIAVYEGMVSHPTPEGVAQATTKTVVKSALWVLGLDFILTAVMFAS